MHSTPSRCRAGAGLLLGAVVAVLAGCAAVGPSPSEAPRTIDVTIDGYHFVLDHFAVHRNESVRFLVSNPDRIGHELYIGTIAEQAERREVGVPAPSEGARVASFGYGLYLPAYAEGEFDYVFSADEDLLIGCHLPGHWEAGMVATIDVEPWASSLQLQTGELTKDTVGVRAKEEAGGEASRPRPRAGSGWA